MALMDRAMQQGDQPAAPTQTERPTGEFQRPDVSAMVSEEDQDAFARVVAAGVRLMTSSEMRDDVQQNVDRDVPIPQKLAEATAGLLLTLDQQSGDGIPVAVIFPAGVELLGECSEVLVAAGQPVTQEDFNEAARMLFVIVGKKLGASDEELMQGAQAALPPEEATSAQEMPQ